MVNTPQGQNQIARQMVDRFVRRFEQSYREFVCHAALPLVLTPELLNYIRNQFLRSDEEEVPWVAEVDLLLSDLCRPVGYEQYVMDSDVRAYLLAKMQSDEESRKKSQEIARLLIGYIKQLAETNPYIREQEIQAQQWAAMVYLDDKRDAAVMEITRLFQAAANSNTNNPGLINRAEMARLSQITKELKQQLENQPEKYRDFLEYAALINQLIAEPSSNTPIPNRIFTVNNEELTVPSQLVSPNTTTAAQIQLQTFEFDVATIEVQREGQETKLNIIKRRQQAQFFTENLSNNVTLEMVAIPGGKFIMGAPKSEQGSRDNERPQHEVTVQPFYMGKYPITQAQWKAVAGLPPVNRELKLDPSRFKGENLPVENISWYDAVEFCDRISRDTGKIYRLPSEAEWEYACRANTTTPFHFGETITPDLANYRGSSTYGAGTKGEYRERTTTVGSFKLANDFGLFDMHGNVWEWCADDYHDNYKNAPINEVAWLSNNDNRKLLRGGSWSTSRAFVVRRLATGASPTTASSTTSVFGLWWLRSRVLFELSAFNLYPLIFFLLPMPPVAARFFLVNRRYLIFISDTARLNYIIQKEEKFVKGFRQDISQQDS